MSDLSAEVPVTFQLPRPIYDRVNQTATDEQKSVGDMLTLLVSEGLDAHASSRQLWERVSADYRGRLARNGKWNQSPEAVLDELRAVREQIASELYP